MRHGGSPASIAAVKLPSLRHRGLRPATMKARVRRRLKLSDVSQSRLNRFLREVGGELPVVLPREAPSSLALVVPCYKHAGFLPDALESILAQTRLPNEVIFVDDCSPDATGEIIGEFIAAHPWPAGGRLELLVNDRNLGQAASLNRGIAAASSDLIMILNDDDYLMEDAVESMLAYFSRHRDVALIGATCLILSGDDALASAAKASTAYAPPDLPLVYRRPQEVPGYRLPTDLNMTHSTSTFLKVAWAVVGGYRVNKKDRVVPYSDRDFQMRVNAVWPVAVADRTPYCFWRNYSSVDRGRNS